MTVSILLRLSGRVIPLVIFIVIKKVGGKKGYFVKTYFSVGFCLPVILNQTLLSTCEYTHTRSRGSGLFTFLTRRDWNRSDVCRFSLASSFLKAHSQ